MLIKKKRVDHFKFSLLMNSCSVFSTVGKKIRIYEGSDQEKKWNYFFKKSFQKKLINSFAYYLKIGIPHNILKDLREIFNISRNIKYFHFSSGQSLHKFTKFTYRFIQNVRYFCAYFLRLEKGVLKFECFYCFKLLRNLIFIS